MLLESCLQLPLGKRTLYPHPLYVAEGDDGGACRLLPLLMSALPAVMTLQRCSHSHHVVTLQGEHNVTGLALTLEA